MMYLHRIRRPTGRTAGTCRRFLSARCGSVAVEWAMIGPIFIVILLFGFEGMAHMLMSNDLDRALREVAYEIRTGQAQSIAAAKNWTPEQYLAQRVCEKYSYGDCTGKLEAAVQAYGADGRPVTGSGPSEIYRTMTIQVVSVKMPFSLQTMSRIYSDKPWTLAAAQAYMTEPF